MFLCDKCINQDEQPVCLVCEKKDGLLHKIENKNYVLK